VTTDRGFPPARFSIVDPKTGRSTNAFWRLLETLWRRTGGFEDIGESIVVTDARHESLIESVRDDLSLSVSGLSDAGARLFAVQKHDVDSRQQALESRVGFHEMRLASMDPDFTHGAVTANRIGYRNAASGLAARQVQAAIDELVLSVGDAGISGLLVTGDTPGPIFVTNGSGEPVYV